MALEVIGAGFGRTGTLTLKTALEMLDFGPCHHMVEVIEHPEQIPLWNEAADGAAMDWEKVYGSYRATVDWPGCHFYAQLADFYPQAKVILSRRDPERWFESMTDTILSAVIHKGQDPAAAPPDESMSKFAGIIFQRTFSMDFSKANVIAAFEKHNAEVIRRIPAERLLVFEAAQGWGPLCAHLGVPIPDQAFPRVNDREEFKTHLRKAEEAGL